MQGIYPAIPIGEEREKLKQQYLKEYKKPTIHITVKE